MSVRIYQRIENNMQNGRGNGQGWVLEFDNPQHVHADPLTGWSGSGETQGQVILKFPSREAAIRFAEREGLQYQLFEPSGRTIKIKPYATNFGGRPVDGF
ncbi:ETC complex I subunit [Sphingomonas sp.]|uniref:ETC complex I subunit n=1 Tax=Sphingomonas sp. TaxID=28214 RepID=UPI003B3ABF38